MYARERDENKTHQMGSTCACFTIFLAQIKFTFSWTNSNVHERRNARMYVYIYIYVYAVRMYVLCRYMCLPVSSYVCPCGYLYICFSDSVYVSLVLHYQCVLGLCLNQSTSLSTLSQYMYVLHVYFLKHFTSLSL